MTRCAARRSLREVATKVNEVGHEVRLRWKIGHGLATARLCTLYHGAVMLAYHVRLAGRIVVAIAIACVVSHALPGQELRLGIVNCVGSLGIHVRQEGRASKAPAFPDVVARAFLAPELYLGVVSFFGGQDRGLTDLSCWSVRKPSLSWYLAWT